MDGALDLSSKQTSTPHQHDATTSTPYQHDSSASTVSTPYQHDTASPGGEETEEQRPVASDLQRQTADSPLPPAPHTPTNTTPFQQSLTASSDVTAEPSAQQKLPTYPYEQLVGFYSQFASQTTTVNPAAAAAAAAATYPYGPAMGMLPNMGLVPDPFNLIPSSGDPYLLSTV